MLEGRKMDFNYVTKMNEARCKLWHGEADPWTLSDWSNALAGEVGEACNIIKKMRRLELGMRQNRSPKTMEEFKQDLSHEIADAFLYLNLLAVKAGIDMEIAVWEKFNIVSSAEGFNDHRLYFSEDLQKEQLQNLELYNSPVK